MLRILKLYTSKAIHLYWISSMIVEQVSQVLATKHQQFSTDVLSTFSNDYRFSHITSSPQFPQFNGEAECAVKTVKGLQKKCDDRKEDHYLALMAYEITPLEHGYSPAELLMSHML